MRTGFPPDLVFLTSLSTLFGVWSLWYGCWWVWGVPVGLENRFGLVFSRAYYSTEGGLLNSQASRNS